MYLLKIEPSEIWFRVIEVSVGNILNKKHFIQISGPTKEGKERGDFLIVTTYNFHYWSLLKEPQIRCSQQNRQE